MHTSYHYIFQRIKQLLKKPHGLLVFKILDKRLATLCQSVLNAHAKESLDEAIAYKRLDTIFRRVLLLGNNQLVKQLENYQVMNESLPYLNVLKNYFDITQTCQQAKLPRSAMQLQQQNLLRLLDLMILQKRLAYESPKAEAMVTALQNLRDAFQKNALSEAQARAQLAVLLRLMPLPAADKHYLATHWLTSTKLTVIPNHPLISNPTQPGASHTVWLYVPHNYVGPPLRHNWQNYFGKPVDNREFLMEQRCQQNVAEFDSPPGPTGPAYS